MKTRAAIPPGYIAVCIAQGEARLQQRNKLLVASASLVATTIYLWFHGFQVSRPFRTISLWADLIHGNACELPRVSGWLAIQSLVHGIVNESPPINVERSALSAGRFFRP